MCVFEDLYVDRFYPGSITITSVELKNTATSTMCSNTFITVNSVPHILRVGDIAQGDANMGILIPLFRLLYLIYMIKSGNLAVSIDHISHDLPTVFSLVTNRLFIPLIMIYILRDY